MEEKGRNYIPIKGSLCPKHPLAFQNQKRLLAEESNNFKQQFVKPIVNQITNSENSVTKTGSYMRDSL